LVCITGYADISFFVVDVETGGSNSPTHLIQLVSAIRTEHHTGNYRHFTHWCESTSAIPDSLYYLENCTGTVNKGVVLSFGEVPGKALYKVTFDVECGIAYKVRIHFYKSSELMTFNGVLSEII